MEDKVNDILSSHNCFIIMFSIKHKLTKMHANWIERKGLQLFLNDQYINQIA